MGRGYIFEADNGMKYIVRCPKCGKENWAPAVSKGKCVFCGYDANGGQ